MRFTMRSALRADRPEQGAGALPMLCAYVGATLLVPGMGYASSGGAEPARPAPVAGATLTTSSTSAALPVAVEVVHVSGTHAEPSRTGTLSRAEVRQLPGAFGDPFRAVEALPGVTPIASGLPYFYVRGAPPGNVGYFLDGIRVPYLYHVALGPSVIHPALVDRVDLYSAAYPAAFGRFAGGIVSGEINEPNPAPHGEATLRVFDVGALAETGFAGGKGTVLLGGRYSYTAAIFSLIAKDTRLDYRDFQARVTYQLSPDDRVSLFVFGAYDLLAQTEAGIENVAFASEFYRARIGYERRLGPATRLLSALTLGFDQSRIPGQPRNSRTYGATATATITHAVSPTVVVRGGADVALERFTADTQPYADPDDPTTKRFNGLFPERSDVAVGAFGDVTWSDRGTTLTLGARADVYASGGASALGIDPRFSARVRIAPRLHMIHSLGIAHQPPSFLIPMPGLAVGQLAGGLQRSYQASAGLEVLLPLGVTATVTGFDNVFENMSDTLSVAETRRDASGFREPRSLGSAYGVEFYLRRRLSARLGGYVSYTLSRSTRCVGSACFLSAFDRTHVVNTALSYDLGWGTRAGVRLALYSGAPSAPVGGGAFTAPPRSLSPLRDPVFYRLDARVEKRFRLTDKAWLAVVLEMMNTTLRKEMVLGQNVGPIAIPSLAVEGGHFP